MKKGYDYFDGFLGFADCASRAAGLLRDTLQNFSAETASAKMDEIHAVEHEADAIKHTTFKHLGKEFLPPIEREDIVSMSQELDNVVDGIDEIMRRVCMYQVKEIRSGTMDFCELLLRCCTSLKNLLNEFVNFKKSTKIVECMIRLNSLETEGDTLHFKAVRKLYGTSTDALNIIVWKDIYDCFEECYDACEHVGDIIEGVVLKNS